MPASVLIVDDEPGMRELVTRWLTGHEYVAREAPTVALVDLQMPGRGGAWLIDQLRLSYPAISVILATANDRVPGTLSLQPSDSIDSFLDRKLTRGNRNDAGVE